MNYAHTRLKYNKKTWREQIVLGEWIPDRVCTIDMGMGMGMSKTSEPQTHGGMANPSL